VDPDLQREVLDVRKVIEKSTSKVSLRDLEKKGFRQVKVLRAGDINQLIFKAVQNVLARQPRGGMSEEERQKVIKEARGELDRQLAEKRALQQQGQELERKHGEIQQAHRNLQAKLNDVNVQLAQEKKVFLAEKQQFERDKQALMERSLEGQKSASDNYERQIGDLRQRLGKAEARTEESEARSRDGVPRHEVDDLRERLAKAEARAEAARDSIPKDEHDQVRRRLNTQVDDLQEDCDRYRRQLRQIEEETAGQLTKLKRSNAEFEESDARLTTRVHSLEEEVERLKAEAAEGGGKAVHDAEFQRLRMEMDQRSARMQDMMAGIANSLVESRKEGGGGGGGGDFSKQFADLQRSITSSIRKATGTGKDDFDLTAEQAAALFAQQDDVILETNITDMEIKQQTAAGVNSKLARLRNLRNQ
jgi:predicted  nucleic acid-binding Zn-ribbon protein